jgi:2-dehydropantoate 2-reductase
VRYVIYGAGAIGGTIGAKLFQQGRETVLICRGAHLEAIRENGLTILTPEETHILQVPVAGSPAEIDWREGDVAILAMKSQDTYDALRVLRDTAGDVPVVCAQNGVANERMAVRLFSRVYGMVVWMPCTHLNPGEVLAHSAPVTGCLDSGCYPEGTDDLIEELAKDFRESSFACDATSKVMRHKYAKLLTNLLNAVQALCGTKAAGDLVRGVRGEAAAAYKAAGIETASYEEVAARRADVTIKSIPGHEYQGGSGWQSLSRGSSLETDYLNGEIALLGSIHGVPTPYNRMLQLVAAEASSKGRAAGSYTPEALQRRLS